MKTFCLARAIRQSAAKSAIQSHRRFAKRPCPGWIAFAIGAIASVVFSASAQSYSIDWYKVAGGGGTRSNGQYSISIWPETPNFGSSARR